MLGYALLTKDKMRILMPTCMANKLMSELLNRADNFARKLATETLLTLEESTIITRSLLLDNKLNSAIRYYEDTDFERFMNYLEGLKVGGIKVGKV